MKISLALHLLAVPAQIWVVDHFYGGIADWNRYVAQGTILGSSFRHFDFSLTGANIHGIVGDSSVSIMAGAFFAIFGSNKLAIFFIFSWLAFLGLVLFYRAFSMTFEGANLRRYALLLFFLPSLIFWTADVSKESVVTVGLGLIAYGGAKFLSKRQGGLLPIILGTAITAYVRPNELAIAIAGLVLAVMVMPASPWLRYSGIRRAGIFVVMSALLVLAAFLTQHFLGKGGINLSKIASNNSGHGSSIPYHPGIQNYWRDAYSILFDPLPFNAHGNGERLAAVENLIIIGVLLSSFRQLRIVVRTMFARTYVLMCTVYSLLFLYAFAALGNLGLITRERTLLLPFLLVPLSIPVTEKGSKEPYEWELKRRDRLRLRGRGGQPGTSKVPVGVGGRRYPQPVVPPRDRRPPGWGRSPVGSGSIRT